MPMTVPPAEGTPPRFTMDAESSYILDCEVEFGGITPLEAQVLRTETPAARAFLTRPTNRSLPAHWLRNTAREYLESLSLESRYVWALYGLPGMQYGLDSFRERIEFAVQCQVQQDLGVRNRSTLDFAGLEQASAVTLFPTVHDVTPEKVYAFVEERFAEGKARLEDDLQLLADAVRWYRAGNQATARQLAHTLGILAEAEVVVTAQEVHAAVTITKRDRRQARGAIKKALRLFSRTGTEDNARLLASGREVVLEHPESPFKFVLRPYAGGWLETKTAKPGGHVPYQLSLLTKDDVFLSRLCVLFDRTPVLDQLLALTMFVRAGDEMELLQKANWFGMADRSAVRDYLVTHAPALVDRAGLGQRAEASEEPPSEWFALDRAFKVEQEHWAPYKGPVQQWIAGWFGDLADGYARLTNAQAPQLA